MTILVDFHQIAISNIMQQVSYHPDMKLEEDLIRHMILNSLRGYSKQFKSRFGDLIICCDSRTHWRRAIFPYYKAHRKRDREKSVHDWTMIFDTIEKIKNELKECFPYKVVEVEGAEADDIIAYLVKEYSKDDDILILSGDKDFVQLQKYPGVVQYSPILKQFIRVDDPDAYTKEHILRGDRGDGIPNFLSDDDTFVVTDKRQKKLNSKKVEEWIKGNPQEFCNNHTMQHGYSRNKQLVDLDCIPSNIITLIHDAVNIAHKNSRQKLLDYFIDKRLKNLIEVITEF